MLKDHLLSVPSSWMEEGHAQGALGEAITAGAIASVGSALFPAAIRRTFATGLPQGLTRSGDGLIEAIGRACRSRAFAL